MEAVLTSGPRPTLGSARSMARLAGVLYLVLLVCGPFSMIFVPSAIVVPGDASATAQNLLVNEGLVRAGLVSDAIIFLTEVVLVAVLYVLFRPVSLTLALAAAFARLAMATVQGVNLFGNFAALRLVGADYLGALAPAERHALAMLALDLRGYGAQIWEAFFGLHCVLLAYLIYRSGFLPRALGVLMAIAAGGYLAHSLGNFALPQYGPAFAVIVGVAAIFGELPLLLWLLIKGVDEARYAQRSMA